LGVVFWGHFLIVIFSFFGGLARRRVEVVCGFWVCLFFLGGDEGGGEGELPGLGRREVPLRDIFFVPLPFPFSSIFHLLDRSPRSLLMFNLFPFWCLLPAVLVWNTHPHHWSIFFLALSLYFFPPPPPTLLWPFTPQLLQYQEA